MQKNAGQGGKLCLGQNSIAMKTLKKHLGWIRKPLYRVLYVPVQECQDKRNLSIWNISSSIYFYIYLDKPILIYFNIIHTHIHLPAITLKPLTAELKINYLIQWHLARDRKYWAPSEQSILKAEVQETGKWSSVRIIITLIRAKL